VGRSSPPTDFFLYSGIRRIIEVTELNIHIIVTTVNILKDNNIHTVTN
jgi:hypothetical protein